MMPLFIFYFLCLRLLGPPAALGRELKERSVGGGAAEVTGRMREVEEVKSGDQQAGNEDR